MEDSQVKPVIHIDKPSSPSSSHVEPNIQPQYSYTLPELIMAVAFLIQAVTPLIKVLEKKSDSSKQ